MSLPATQQLQSGSDIWTFQDVVEHVLDMFENDRNGRPLRMARRAAREALRELYMVSGWQYFTTTHYFKTKAKQTDGTIEYTHAGYSTGTGMGTDTYTARTVVLTGATWPSDVVNWKIIISGQHYSIESRVDDDEITLPEGENPGADVDSGTSYTLYKEAYVLPHGIAQIGTLVDLDNDWEVPVVSSHDQLARKHLVYDTPDTPWQVALRNSGVLLNDMSLVFSPPPSTEEKYVFSYQRKPRDLKTEVYETGTATVSSGSKSVSLGGQASLANNHVGCVIRFGSGTQPPTPIPGSIDNTDNPFTDQAVILSQSETSCTLDTAVSQGYSSVKYTISDPLDIDHAVMLDAYLRLCEAKFARLNKRESKEVQQLTEQAYYELRMARERNNRTINMPRYVAHDPFNNVTVETDE